MTLVRLTMDVDVADRYLAARPLLQDPSAWTLDDLIGLEEDGAIALAKVVSGEVVGEEAAA